MEPDGFFVDLATEIVTPDTIEHLISDKDYNLKVFFVHSFRAEIMVSQTDWSGMF